MENYGDEIGGNQPATTPQNAVQFANQQAANGQIPNDIQKEFDVMNLIQAYRHRGHLFTNTNPVRERRHYEPTLDLSLIHI